MLCVCLRLKIKINSCSICLAIARECRATCKRVTCLLFGKGIDKNTFFRVHSNSPEKDYEIEKQGLLYKSSAVHGRIVHSFVNAQLCRFAFKNKSDCESWKLLFHSSC